MKVKTLILVTIIGFSLIYSCKNENLKSSSGEINYACRAIDISSLGPAYLKTLNEKIYKAVQEGNINAFKNDSLLVQSKFNEQEIKEIGGIEEAIQYAPDPNYPDFLVDTVIFSPFRLTDVVGYEIADVWSFNKGSNTYSATPHAFAITYKPIIAGIELNELPLYWIPYPELEDLLGSENYKVLNDLIFQKTIEKLSEF
ncbi:MAG: hypothetical protein HN921_03395 [Bacteroidetes bacterium]|nr:hypothetical protein [Bacteroidota bacterium]MBT4728682.1 hypothetical protein [Bacteroidota bacterium]MBT7038866.1 hypothetical protein [Bacteroidota bacterium]